MNSLDALFTHSVARFRSSLPLPTLQLWSKRHFYDLALALGQAAESVLGRPVPFLALSLEARGPARELFLAIEIDGAAFDIFGTNVRARIEEGLFDEVGEIIERRIDGADNLFLFLASHDFFLDYWPPEADFSSLVRDGILSAAHELSPA